MVNLDKISPEEISLAASCVGCLGKAACMTYQFAMQIMQLLVATFHHIKWSSTCMPRPMVVPTKELCWTVMSHHTNQPLTTPPKLLLQEPSPKDPAAQSTDSSIFVFSCSAPAMFCRKLGETGLRRGPGVTLDAISARGKACRPATFEGVEVFKGEVSVVLRWSWHIVTIIDLHSTFSGFIMIASRKGDYESTPKMTDHVSTLPFQKVYHKRSVWKSSK